MPTRCRCRSGWESRTGVESLAEESRRLIRIKLVEEGGHRHSPEIEHERAVAVHDLEHENSFELINHPGGPYVLGIVVRENRLVLDVRDPDDRPLEEILLPLGPLRSIIRDYFHVCDAYYEAIKTATPSRIEAIDMGRRGLHDEGAERLRDRLATRVRIDEATARRLFTLICILQSKETSW